MHKNEENFIKNMPKAELHVHLEGRWSLTAFNVCATKSYHNPHKPLSKPSKRINFQIINRLLMRTFRLPAF